MDNPGKLEQEEENQNNNTTQYVLDTTMQNVEKTWALNKHSFYAEILTNITRRNSEHNDTQN